MTHRVDRRIKSTVARHGSLIVAAMLTVAFPVSAQQRDTIKSDTLARADSVRRADERPFVRGGVYDKPYQTRLFGRTAIGGYAEAHARYERVDGVRETAGFQAKRMTLFAYNQVSDLVRFAMELEFENGTEEILIEFAAIDLRIHPSFAIRGGMILSPIGKFNLAHDSPLNEFTDRPLVATELIGVTLAEPGFGALGQFGLGSGGRLTYELYATNGFGDGLITDSEDGTRVRFGRHNVEDNNGSPATVGRLAWSPGVGHELGVSAHHGAYNVFTIDGLRVDRRRNLTIAALDAETDLFGVRVSGEAARVMVDVPEGLRGIYASQQRGFYLEGVRDMWRRVVPTLPFSAISLKTRVEYVDFDTAIEGTSIAQLAVGLNFRPSEESVLKLDYVRGRGRDTFNNAAEHAFVLLSLATYF
jgi:hypothetical protein